MAGNGGRVPPAFVTLCTTCDQLHGVRPLPELTGRFLGARNTGWKVARHAAIPAVSPHRRGPRPLCGAGGVVVDDRVVMPNRETEGSTR